MPIDVLVIEDDELMAELLAEIIQGVYASVTVRNAASRVDALHAWETSRPDLVICDWQLPDGSGIDVLRARRNSGDDAPVIMVTGRSDRNSVLAAARFGISGYITKPFKPDMVRSRLLAALPGDSPQATNTQPTTFMQALEQAVRHGVQLTSTLDPAEVVALRDRHEPPSRWELTRLWQGHATLQTRLIDLANNAVFRRGGKPVESLPGALDVLGLKVALDMALAIALNLVGELKTDFLRARARQLDAEAEGVARQAVDLARMAGVDERGCFAAGMLHRIGEFAVISVAQQWVNQHGVLEESIVEQALLTHAARLAGAMKAQWRLSVELKQMIGAVHGSVSGSDHQRFLVMRAAALLAGGKVETSECHRLLRRLGVDPDRLMDQDD